jgi:hypothetical protein
MNTNLKDELQWLSQETAKGKDPRRMLSHHGRMKVGSTRPPPSLVDFKIKVPVSNFMPGLEQPKKVKSLLKMITSRGINKERLIKMKKPYKIPNSRRQSHELQKKEPPVGRDGPSPGSSTSVTSSSLSSSSSSSSSSLTLSSASVSEAVLHTSPASSPRLNPLLQQKPLQTSSDRKELNSLFSSQDSPRNTPVINDKDFFDEDDDIDDDALMAMDIISVPKLSQPGFMKASSLPPPPPRPPNQQRQRQRQQSQQLQEVYNIDDDGGKEDMFSDDDDEALMAMNVDIQPLKRKDLQSKSQQPSSFSSCKVPHADESNSSKEEMQQEIEIIQRKLKQDSSAVMTMAMNGTCAPASLTQRIKTSSERVAELKRIIDSLDVSISIIYLLLF